MVAMQSSRLNWLRQYSSTELMPFTTSVSLSLHSLAVDGESDFLLYDFKYDLVLFMLFMLYTSQLWKSLLVSLMLIYGPDSLACWVKFNEKTVSPEFFSTGATRTTSTVFESPPLNFGMVHFLPYCFKHGQRRAQCTQGLIDMNGFLPLLFPPPDFSVFSLPARSIKFNFPSWTLANDFSASRFIDTD